MHLYNSKMMRLRMYSRSLQRLSSGPVALLTAAIFVVFMVVVLPAQAAESAAISGVDATPDTMIFYTAGELYDLAEAMGETGRSHYIRSRFTFDVIWPVVYVTFFATTIGWLAQCGFAPASRWQMANLLPFVAVIFDALENLSASLALARYPAPTPIVAELAGVFTLLKWVSVALTSLTLIVVLVAAAVQRIIDQRRQ